MDTTTDDEARLLVREREELARVAHRLSIGEPAFVLLVCAPRLRAVVLAEIRSYEHLAALPTPTPMATPEAVLDELSAERAFRSMALGAGDDPMRALNWHREKLRRAGVTFVWLDDVVALEHFRTIAPDAYSFRDGLVIVDGVPVFRVEAPMEERASLRLARRRYDRAKGSQERLEAGGEYVEQLRINGREDNALEVALSLRSSLRTCLSTPPKRLVPILLAASQMSAAAGNGGACVEALSIVKAVLAIARITSEPETQARLLRLIITTPDPPHGYDADAIAFALQIASSLPFPFREVLPDSLRVAAAAARSRGRVNEARRLAEEASPRITGAFNRMLARVEIAITALKQGRSDEALSELREAWSHEVQSTYSPVVEGLIVLNVHHAEVEAARCLIDSSIIRRGGADRLMSGHLVTLAVLSGDWEAVLASLERLVTSPPAECDATLHRACNDSVGLLEALHAADRLDPSLLPYWDALLADAQARLLAMGDPDPPWYRVLLPSLRADLLALRPARRPEAIALYRESWELARLRYPEAAPGIAVRLLDTLLAADDLATIPALLDAADAVAVARGRLNDQMALLVRRILHTFRTAPDPDPAAYPPLRAQLDAVFVESGSLVLQGNTLLALAQKLPPAPATPDPLALADEARRLFAELAMPHEEMLCVERAAEIVLARGDREGARQRFQQCLRRRRLYGLGMRIPHLERLLASASDDSPITA